MGKGRLAGSVISEVQLSPPPFPTAHFNEVSWDRFAGKAATPQPGTAALRSAVCLGLIVWGFRCRQIQRAPWVPARWEKEESGQKK